jgi:hypothetical protein
VGVGINWDSLNDKQPESMFVTKDDKGKEIPQLSCRCFSADPIKMSNTVYRYHFANDHPAAGYHDRKDAETSPGGEPGYSALKRYDKFIAFQEGVSFEITDQRRRSKCTAAPDDLKLFSAERRSGSLSSMSPPARALVRPGRQRPRRRSCSLDLVAAVAGTFVLKAEEGKMPEMWGITGRFELNLGKLRRLGLDAKYVRDAALQHDRRAQTGSAVLRTSGTKTWDLPAKMFRFQASGRFVIHVPDFNEDEIMGTQLFAIRGTLFFEPSSKGLQVFVDAEVEVGPDDFQLFELRVVGVLIINKEGIAGDLELSLKIGARPGDPWTSSSWTFPPA